jgi:hypothetical protein
MRGGVPLARLIDEIRLIWHATGSDEWIDQMLYIPY